MAKNFPAGKLVTALAGKATDTLQTAGNALISAGNVLLTTISTKLTDGSQKAQVVDSGGTPITQTGGALDVNLKTADTDPATETTLAAFITAMTDGSAASQFVDESGTPYGVKHIGNKPRVSAMPYGYDVTEGNVSGHTRQQIVASVTGAGTSWTDMWGGAPGTPNAPVESAAVAMEIVGGAQDTAGGTGISQVGIHYLDSNGYAQDSVVQLTGTTPVALGNILHINAGHAAVPGSGSTAPHVASANIDIRNVGTPAKVYARIPAGSAAAPRFVFRVPTGKTGYWTDLIASVLALANNSDAFLRVAANVDVDGSTLLSQGIWIQHLRIVGGPAGANMSSQLALPQRFPAGAIVRCQVMRGSGSGTADGSVTGIGWIE